MTRDKLSRLLLDKDDRPYAKAKYLLMGMVLRDEIDGCLMRATLEEMGQATAREAEAIWEENFGEPLWD